jgi:hypothetical protein
MADDVRLNMKVRKAIASCGFDLTRIRIRVTRGRIYMQGSIKRTGEDPEDPESNMPFLEKLDGLLRDLPGFKDVRYTFDNWKLTKGGAWQFSGKQPKKKKKPVPGTPETASAGENVAPEADAVETDETEAEPMDADSDEQPDPAVVPL